MKNIVTEIGEVGSFAYLVTADTKYNKEGDFKSTIKFNIEDLYDLRELVNDLLNKKTEEMIKNKPQLKQHIGNNDPIQNYIDKNGNEVEGLYFIKVKSKFKPKVFNSDNELINPKDIFMGSKVVLNLDASAYYIPASKSVGVSFYIKAIQVIDLVESYEEWEERFKVTIDDNKKIETESSAEDFGFGKVETKNKPKVNKKKDVETEEDIFDYVDDDEPAPF